MMYVTISYSAHLPTCLKNAHKLKTTPIFTPISMPACGNTIVPDLYTDKGRTVNCESSHI